MPGWLRSVAAIFVRGRNAEFVLGDLADDWARQRAARGRVACALRTLRLAVASSWVMGGSALQPGSLLAAGLYDLRFAARSLRKHPGFTAVAVLTLALGIGANAAIFSVVQGVLLAPLPYPEPERVVNVWQVYREWQSAESALFRSMADRFPASWPVYLQWRQRSRALQHVAVYGNYPTIVDGIDVAEWVNVVSTTRSFTDVLGVQPALGRWFDESEDRVGGDRVVVISHRYWQRLGGEATVLGRTLRLHGDPFTVIGVMPAGFYFPDRSYDMWYPVPGGRRNDRYTSQSMSAIARLASGVTIEDAGREMDEIAARIIEQEPDAIDAGVRLVPRIDEVAGGTAGTLRLLASAVGLVLLVAAANVAGLLLVRATSRRQELAVRSALGARRGRLTMQLMVEGALLAALGGALGLGAVAATLGGLRRLLPADTPRIADIALNWQVAAFVTLVSIAVAGLFGLLSALHLRQRDPVEVLGQVARVTSNTRGRAVLVIGEIAVSVVLLSAAALIASSYYRLTSTDTGLHTEGLLSLHVSAPIDVWHEEPAELQAFFRDVSSRLTALPGVVGTAAVSSLPFSGSRNSSSFGFVENPTAEEETGWGLEQKVSPSYFELMGIPILAGRTLAADPAGTSETVISDRMARRYWPDDSPLGRTIWDNGVPHVIVGVAADTIHAALDEEIQPKRYRLFERSNQATASYVLRIDGDAATIAQAATAAAREAAGGTTVKGVASLTDLVSRTTALPRFRTQLLVALAGLAMMLSAIGLYGVVAFAVAARRQEFGLRMTLGAGARQVAGLVLRDGLRLTLPGIALGVLGAIGATTWLGSYLYQVQPRDPAILAAVAATVALQALVTMALPAWRALRVDPMVALRGS